MDYCHRFLQTLLSLLPGSEQTHTARGRSTLSLIALLAMGLIIPAARAQNYTEQTLTNFQGGDNDGARVYAGLLNVNGIFYGTTTEGGGYGFIGYGFGTIYSFNPATHTEKVIYHFQGDTSDGAIPYGGLIAVNNKLYGVTEQCGSAGKGIIFSFDLATSTETILHNFQDSASGAFDGSSPFGGLTYNSATGKLYGTTRQGGGNGNGTIFSINPDGTGYQTLFNLAASAYDIQDRMILVNGIFYGTSNQGGPDNDGTVFSFDPATNTLSTLHNFSSADGANPNAGLINVGATLYGTTAAGGSSNAGTVFSINTSAYFHTLHTFQGGTTDGSGSRSSLLNINGILYGTTTEGGFANDGTVFSLDTNNNTETVLYSFLGQAYGDGTNPDGNLLSYNGTLYGITDLGGANSSYYFPIGAGTIFALTTASLSAHNDTYAPKYQTAYAVKAPGVLANDNAEGAGTMTATLVAPPNHGTLAFNADGSFLYTPANGFIGADQFLYYASTPAGKSNTATVTLNVQAAPPVAHTDAYTVNYQTAYAVSAAKGVLANDSNGDPGTITTALVSAPSHGALTFQSDGSFTYTPNAGFFGSDSFTYQDTNAVGTSNIAPVNLTILPPPPVAHNDTYAPKYQTPYAVKSPGVLANDSNGGSSSLTAALVTSPTNGTLTFNADGSFTYTPANGFIGTDSFTYQAVNATGRSNTATVTLNVQGAPPTARNDAYAPKYATAYAVKAPGVLANDSNGGTGSMTAVLVSTVSHGSLTFNSDGSFTYTPSAGFVGADTFTYHAINAAGTSNTATVTLNVTAAVPVAHNDAYSVKKNTLFAIKAPGVLANDYAGGTGLIAIAASQPGHGTLTFSNDGSFTYTPDTGYTGTDAFIYYDANSVGTSNTATITLTVQ